MILLLALACGSPPPPADLLAFRPATITLPAAAPATAGPYPVIGCVAEGEQWRCPLPIRGYTWGPSRREAPPGMRLLADGVPLRFLSAKTSPRPAPSWTLDGPHLLLRLDGPPIALTLDDPGAAAAEARLRPTTAAEAQQRYVDGPHSAQALALPAGAAATWAVTPSPGARLRGTLRLPPSRLVADPDPDGATLEVWADGQPLATLPFGPGAQALDLPLPKGAHQLELRATGTPPLDRALLEDLRIVVPRPKPRRLLFVFIDTLRADRLGAWGHSRPTPALDALAAQGARFAQARAIAPWTLPSTRALLTGRSPDRWEPARSLFVDLAQAGWFTQAIVANTWLNASLGMTDGFAQHDFFDGATAVEQVERAQAALSAHPDEDLALLVHLMDVHQPHREPPAWAHRYVGDTPEELRRPYNGATLRSLRIDPRRLADLRQYLFDRYDQSVGAVDEALAPLLAAVGDDATIVFFGDHGEELWDHGGVEHGHSLYDELLHVPLVLRDPAIAPAVVDTPVTLLDLAPTLRALLGLPADPASDGRSLLPLLRGADLPPKDVPIGWTLYGQSAWGLLAGADKWVLQGTHAAHYNTAGDPAEKLNLGLDLTSPDLPRRLGAALGRPLARRLRLGAPGLLGGGALPEARITLTHPDGLPAAWPRTDWIGRATPPRLQDGALLIERAVGQRLPSEVFVEAPATPGLHLTLTVGDQRYEADADTLPAAVGPHGQQATLDAVWTPDPLPQAAAPLDPLLDAQLRALGYADN